MAWQGLGEAVLGLETLATLTFMQFQSQHPFLQQSGLFNKLLRGLVNLPVGGAAIGVLAALTAPLLWPAATKYCWAPDMRAFLLGGDDITWLMDAYFRIVIPVGIPVGFLSGLSLHQLLRPVMLGVEGTAWYTLSLPALAGISTLCVLLYQALLPGGSAKSTSELVWVRRLDPVSGDPISVNLTTKEVVQTHAQARLAEQKMAAIEGFHFLRRFRQAVIDWWVSSSSEYDRSSSPDSRFTMSHSRPLPKFNKDSDYSLQEVADAEALFQLTDVLVRYKHLELQQLAGVRKEEVALAMEELKLHALQSLDVKNIASLSKEIEKLCVLSKAVDADDCSGDDGDASVREAARRDRATVMADVADKVKKHRPEHKDSSSFSFFGDYSSVSAEAFHRAVSTPCRRDSHAKVKGHRAISLLAHDSIGILENELQEKIGYVIKPLQDKDEERKFISNHHYEKRLDSIQQGLWILSYSILPIVGCYALLTKR